MSKTDYWTIWEMRKKRDRKAKRWWIYCITFVWYSAQYNLIFLSIQYLFEAPRMGGKEILFNRSSNKFM